MCDPIFSKGKAVVMDSDFFVENRIVILAAKRLYSGTLIKKRRYLPKRVPGYLIDQNFLYKKVGGVDMLEAAT